MSKRIAQSSSRDKRLVPLRASGIPKKSDAPFWRGETAEKLVEQRVAEGVAEQERKSAERAAKRQAKKRTPGEPRAKRERTPQQLLRRLERALGRRKTFAARQRVQAQIAQLKRQLGDNS